MSDFGYFCSLILLVLAGYGGAELFRKLIHFIKSKKRRKKPNEIEREIDEILHEHIG